MKNYLLWFRWAAACAVMLGCSWAQQVSPALKEKLDVQFKRIEAWAAEPVLVAAVKAHNASPPAEYASMNQETWRGLSVLDPLVRNLAKNESAQFLKGQRSELVTEAFLSDKEGRKVAFIAKTTNWSHLGKPKHDEPMKGNRWVGPIEVDESSGEKQIQIAVPVLDEGHPIGSLVVGLSISGLAK